MHDKSWGTKLTTWVFGAALLAFMAAMPFYSAFGASAHNSARLAQLPLFLLATLFMLVGDRTRWSRANVMRAAALLLLMVISAWHAHQPAAAFRELSLVLSLFFLTLAISALQEEIGMQKILLAIVASWLIYEIFFLLAWGASALNQGAGRFWLMVPGFDNPRFLNHAQAPALPILIGIASDSNNGVKLRRLGWVAATLSIAIVIGLAGRAIGVALLASALAAAILFRRQGVSYLKYALVSLIFALAFYLCVFYVLPLQLDAAVITAQHSANDMVSDHSRLFLWKIAFAQWISSPWVGVGPMHFSEYVNLRGAHPHNIYIQTLAEYGLPIALLLLYWLSYQLWQGIRRRRAANSELTVFDVSLTAAVFALAIDGFFSGNFVMPVSQVWICIAVALFANGSSSTQPPPATQPISRLAQRLIIFVFLIFQVLFAYPTVTEYGMARPTLGQRPPSPESEPNNPRFWFDGWL